MSFIGWLAMAWLACGAALVLCGAARRWRARGAARRRFCSGPKRRWWAATIDATRWLRRTPCGYDLSYAPTLAEGGSVRCPECGTAHARPQRELLASTRQWRLTRLGVLILATGVPLYRAREPLGALAITRASSGVLLSVEAALGAGTPLEVQDALRERALRQELTAEEMTRLLPALVRDLRDDDVRWNADRARTLLEAEGAAAIPALRAALRSEDHQQRHLAVQALWAMDAAPTYEVLRVTVEALREDSGKGHYTLHNAGAAVAYLLRYPDTSDELLQHAMRGDDLQQRLLAAAVAGFTKRLDLADEAVPILVPHLRRNQITGDALYALVALHRFGPSVLPQLESALTNETDPQARESLSFVIHHLLPDEEQERREPPPTPDVTHRRANPLWFEPEDLLVPFF